YFNAEHLYWREPADLSCRLDIVGVDENCVDRLATSPSLKEPASYAMLEIHPYPGNEKAPAFARASELPILTTRKIGRMVI
ncbi:TPA: hypothetical protein ACIXWT_006789, partial [Pseudomonas aeruginosa]